MSARHLRLGILGGTFDPIHLGHVALAVAARRCAELDRVLLVPAQIPPHKAGPAAGPEDRLAMCRLAVRDVAGLDVSDIEIRRSGPSYTLDTLRELREVYPGADLHLILGWDAARLLPEWREPASVLSLARLVVFPRPGVAPPAPDDLRRAGLEPDRTTLCTEGTPAVAATEVRRRAAAGESLTGLVAPEVEEYIRRHRLYGSSGGDNGRIG